MKLPGAVARRRAGESGPGRTVGRRRTAFARWRSWPFFAASVPPAGRAGAMPVRAACAGRSPAPVRAPPVLRPDRRGRPSFRCSTLGWRARCGPTSTCAKARLEVRARHAGSGPQAAASPRRCGDSVRVAVLEGPPPGRVWTAGRPVLAAWARFSVRIARPVSGGSAARVGRRPQRPACLRDTSSRVLCCAVRRHRKQFCRK